MMPGGWGFGGLGGVGGGLGGIRGNTSRFEEQYHCYSVAYADKSHLEKGDKILLPPSAFDTLARLQVDYPMLFKLTSHDNKQTHCGVLEFTAEEGCCYIPFWMMQNLLIEEGALITVTNVSLPKATFVKLQPQSVDFLEISNPRAVLEHALRNFSCVTIHDIIQIPYNNKNYHFELKDVKPAPAACIIETDCNVDFDAPVGYVEPERPNASQASSIRSSACPSPSETATSVSTAMSALNTNNTEDNDEKNKKPPGIRIIDGKIIRPDDNNNNNSNNTDNIPVSDMIAEKMGTTGVQKNSAIPEQAPSIDYWAIAAGDGARLDGKKPSELKDTSGNIIDIRKLRAEAAAKRAKEQEAAAAAKLASIEGKTVTGEIVQPSQQTQQQQQPISKRKKRVGNKYSKLKANAFHGSANQFH